MAGISETNQSETKYHSVFKYHSSAYGGVSPNATWFRFGLRSFSCLAYTRDERNDSLLFRTFHLNVKCALFSIISE